ncbi:hypothetical protein CVT24_013397 [Panaeolus cyanescens]|uniref:Uncharacterized protein n=1 Tax=Panaeolus cyanescens TaxID=181874 RepID=A0A409YNY5_9AGAR|nr:hypothetical protein CVT24_013397 [Panaeolus cyanescens]
MTPRTVTCLGYTIPPNPDISGIGVRTAIYLQSLLCIIPAIISLCNSRLSKDDLEFVRAQSMTGITLSLAMLISATCQALVEETGLAPYHLNVVLSVCLVASWNLGVYGVMKTWMGQRKLKGTRGREGAGRRIVDSCTSVNVDQEAAGIEAGSAADNDQIVAPRPRFSKQTSHVGRIESSLIKILRILHEILSYRTLAILNTALLASLGLWFWSNPYTFGVGPHDPRSIDCVSLFVFPELSNGAKPAQAQNQTQTQPTHAVDVDVAFEGFGVPLSSKSLQGTNLTLYALFCVGLVWDAVVCFWGVDHARVWRLLYDRFFMRSVNCLRSLKVPSGKICHRKSGDDGGERKDVIDDSNLESGSVLTDKRQDHSPSNPKHERRAGRWKTFTSLVSILILITFQGAFIASIETTLRMNRHIRSSGGDEEEQWGFGQVLALVMMITPLRDTVEYVSKYVERRRIIVDMN